MAFEGFMESGRSAGRARGWRRATLVLSLSLHMALLLFGVAHSFWQVDELQPPAVAISLLATMRPPPPPPPPPPPAAIAKAEPPKPRTKPRPTPVTALVQPVAKPIEAPPAEADPTPEAPAGEVGGVAGGTPSEAPPAPAAPPAATAAVARLEEAPTVLPPSVGTGQRLSSLDDPQFRPSLPPALSRTGLVFWGLFKICVSTQGQVQDVHVLKSADPAVDDGWIATIHRWKYRPYSLNGRPVPFCHAARLEVRTAP